jgi:hypothetical protein
MGSALLQHFREISRLIAEADRHGLKVRYEIAVHCQEVRNGDGNGGKYGAKAVRKLTRALAWSKTAVYDYANVAVTWPDKNNFVEPEPKLPPDLTAAIQNYGSQVATFKRTAATFGQHVRRKMEEVDPADLGDGLLEQMRQARHDLNELLGELDETIRQFEERRKSQSTVPSDDEAPATGDSDGPVGDEQDEQQATTGEPAIPVLT